MSKTQIGWYYLKEDHVFRNEFEFAAWYEDVLVKAGRYPVYVYDLTVCKNEDPRYYGKIGCAVNTANVDMDGVIVSDYFASHFYGMPISDYDSSKNAGKPSSHTMRPYIYEVAESALSPDSPWELFPEYEPREINSEWEGEPFTSHGLFKKAVEPEMTSDTITCTGKSAEIRQNSHHPRKVARGR